jgi:hypothetical protein
MELTVVARAKANQITKIITAPGSSGNIVMYLAPMRITHRARHLSNQLKIFF